MYAIDLILKARVTVSLRGLVFRISKGFSDSTTAEPSSEANSQAKCMQGRTQLGKRKSLPWIKGARNKEIPLLLHLIHNTTEAVAAALAGSMATSRNVSVLLTLL